MKNYTITVNGNVYEVSVEEGFTGAAKTTQTPMQSPSQVSPAQRVAPAPTKAPVVAPAQSSAPTSAPAQTQTSGAQGSIKVNAPMPGKILGIKVNVGQAVKRGDVIVILEAMKMENEIVASSDGIVASIDVAVGANVESGEVLATLN